MSKNQKGFAHILLVIFLLAGIVITVYLVGKQTNLLPKAFSPKASSPETSFTLVGPGDCALGFFCAEPQPGEEFGVKLFVRSDIDEANLFQAKMKFPKDLVEVVGFEKEGSLVQNWIEEFYDNSAGTISLVGGVPAPGFQTKFGGESALMSTIVFKAKSEGKGTVNIGIGSTANDVSAIYRNTDNENILQIKRDYDLSIGTKPSPTPTPTPPADSSRVFVTSTTYDGNLGGLAGADAKCQTRADAANLGGTWKAWLSDSTISASSRLIQSTNPYKLLDGKVIANNWADLTDGTLQNPIHVNEFNRSSPYSAAWSNTDIDGSIRYRNGTTFNCLNWSSGSQVQFGNNGISGNQDDTWTRWEAIACGNQVRLYCFEQTSVSPTPTPTPSPTPTPPPGPKGDGNTDGKINLIDMSVLLTDFNKEQGFREPIDMNDDKKINTFDFSLHRKLLIDLQVIKGQ